MKRMPGFTLVELLVALAVTVVLVLILASLVTATLAVWMRGRNRLDTYATARQVLGRISDEVRGAIASSSMSGGQIQFVENANLGAVPSPAPGAAENVFFVAPYPNLGGGDLCVISYALDSSTRQLKRAFISSDPAFNASSSTARYQLSGYTFASSDWHVIADGVLQFELQCYSQTDLDNSQTPSVTWDSTSSSNSAMTGKAPRQIILRLQVIDDRAATQLASLTSGSTLYNSIVTRSARQFSTTVSLPP